MIKDQSLDMVNESKTRDLGSLIILLMTLRRAWLEMLLVTMVVVGISGIVWQSKAAYKSEGVFQFGGPIPVESSEEMRDRKKAEENVDKKLLEKPSTGITWADYKLFSESFSTSKNFDEFVREKALGSFGDMDRLSKTFASRDETAKLIQPIYSFTRSDAKELMDQPKAGSNNIIGLRINFASQTPEGAQTMVQIIGRYVIDSIVYQIYSNKLEFKHREILSKMSQLENEVIANNQLLEKYRLVGADLKKIVSRYPTSATQISRQVVTVTEENARYLSPVTLLETTEIQAAEARESIRKANRELQQEALWLEYYDKVNELLSRTKSGETILLGLESIKESVFKNKNLGDDVIAEVNNMITIDNQKAINVYKEKSRFIAGPSQPGKRSWLPPRVVLVLSALLGILLAILLVLTRHWWRENGQKLFAKAST